MTNPALHTIRRRRVTRLFSTEPISQEQLETIVEMARWAPSASNRRLQTFVVVQDRQRIKQIRALSPGMWGFPTALVVICNDRKKARAQGLEGDDCGIYIDVGTAAENMLLAAHAVGVGAGPVTSFSQAAVQTFLRLPSFLLPVMIVCLGYPQQGAQTDRIRPPKVIHWTDLVYWEQYTADEVENERR